MEVGLRPRLRPVKDNEYARLVVRFVLGVLAEFEREKGRERTTDAAAAMRANGKPISGPSVIDRPELAQRIASIRASGATMQAIADALNAEGVPTLRGGTKWRTRAWRPPPATAVRRPNASPRPCRPSPAAAG